MPATDLLTVPAELRERVPSQRDWNQIVSWVGDLAPLPQVASQAIALSADVNASSTSLATLLGTDSALAARVLKIANSAMYSFSSRVNTLEDAVLLIGFRTVRSIVLAASLRERHRKSGKYERMFWENSLCSAIGAQLIARQLHKDFAEEAFLFGLLHDLGKVVLMQQIPKEYSIIIEQAHEQGRTYCELEQQTLSFSHPLIGSLVAQKWHFSTDICQAILHHHDTLTAPLEKGADKSAITILANLIAHQLGYGHSQGYPDQSAEVSEVASMLNLTSTKLEALIASARATFDEQSEAFGAV